MFKLYEVYSDWDVSKGKYISRHKTKELAEKRMHAEANKRMNYVHYYRYNFIDDKTIIIDFGAYTKFLAIVEE